MSDLRKNGALPELKSRMTLKKEAEEDPATLEVRTYLAEKNGKPIGKYTFVAKQRTAETLALFAQVKALRTSNTLLPQREIAERLGVTKGKIARVIWEMRMEGEL